MECHFLRLWLFGFSFIALAAVIPSSGFAQDVTASVPEAPTEAKGAARGDAPSMIVDPDTNSFRFFIDGKEVARIDARGLRIRENVEYGGTISDVGADDFDKDPAATQGAAE